MATSATPYGARPIGTLSASGSYSGKVQHIKIASAYAVNIFYGDFVKWGDDNPNTTIQKDTGTTSLTPIGIFLGCAYTDPTTGQFTPNQYFPASIAASKWDDLKGKIFVPSVACASGKRVTEHPAFKRCTI